MQTASASNPSLVPAQWAALLLRLPLGAMYIAHALFKAFVLGWPGAIRLFASTGMPGWMAYPTVAAELIGGACLIVGIGARWAALLLAPTLIGAIAFVHGSHGWIYTSPGGGWEYLAVLLFISAAVILLGNGVLSLQSYVFGRGGPATRLERSSVPLGSSASNPAGRVPGAHGQAQRV